MKLIVAHSLSKENECIRYASKVERILPGYKITEVDEKNLDNLMEEVVCIEPVFELLLKGRQENLEDNVIKNRRILIAYIGIRQENERVNFYYEISTHKFKYTEKNFFLSPLTWVSCYSETGKIDTSEYIRCIKVLVTRAKQLKKQLIIYSSIQITNKNYAYRSLTSKIVNKLLEKVPAILIYEEAKEKTYYYHKVSSRKYEPYEEHSVFLNIGLKEAIKKTLYLMDQTNDIRKFKKNYNNTKRTIGLYNNLFYRQIPMNEEIYVVLNLRNFDSMEYYKNLGLNVVGIEDKPFIIFGKKKLLESHKQDLKDKIVPEFNPCILAKEKVEKKLASINKHYAIINEKLKYNGEGTYIGIVDIEGINYTHKTLRCENGESRVACIWEQIKGDKGNYYDNEKINKALKSNEPEKLVPLSTQLTDGTLLFSIAGGKSEDYEGIAKNSQFLVAKINKAPKKLQEIYAGVPSDESALLTDVLIGITRLIEIAEKDKKPLIICIPFNSNLSEHEGASRLEGYLSFLATRTGITFIVPTGEEALAYHHQTLLEENKLVDAVKINVKAEQQSIVGFIAQKYPVEVKISLKPPSSQEVEFQLEKEGTMVIRETVIYSDGFQNNLLNGSRELLFRIEKPEIGTWILDIESKKDIENRVDLWLANKTFNSNVTLEPSSSFMTAGSLSNVKNIVSVGGYNTQGKVVQQNSGRGFSWNKEIVPTLVAQGTSLVINDSEGNGVEVKGTWVATAMIAGVAATLYSQYKLENKETCPTCPMICYKLLQVISQFDVINYPNESQGYGVFNLNKLPLLLSTPLD